jgi:hypothetical protein
MIDGSMSTFNQCSIPHHAALATGTSLALMTSSCCHTTTKRRALGVVPPTLRTTGSSTSPMCDLDKQEEDGGFGSGSGCLHLLGAASRSSSASASISAGGMSERERGRAVEELGKNGSSVRCSICGSRGRRNREWVTRMGHMLEKDSVTYSATFDSILGFGFS